MVNNYLFILHYTSSYEIFTENHAGKLTAMLENKSCYGLDDRTRKSFLFTSLIQLTYLGLYDSDDTKLLKGFFAA